MKINLSLILFVLEQTICEYAPQLRDQYLIYTEKVTDAFSDVLCEAACNQEREFICRSYTFRSESRPGTPQCLLSGDTSQSAGKNAFQIQSGALYSEKLCDGLNPRRETPQRLPQVNITLCLVHCKCLKVNHS